MLLLKRPNPETISRFLAKQVKLHDTFEMVGPAARTHRHGFTMNHRRVKLGEGEQVFKAAKVALQQWKQFQLGWVEACSPDTPIKAGESVAILAHVACLWWLNACRIIYVLDKNGTTDLFGFAYDTLPGHAVQGEEEFLIEWNRTDNTVWCDILSFSRPNHILTWIGYPWLRLLQKRFCREAVEAMLKAVRDIAATEPPPVSNADTVGSSSPS